MSHSFYRVHKVEEFATSLLTKVMKSRFHHNNVKHLTLKLGHAHYGYSSFFLLNHLHFSRGIMAGMFMSVALFNEKRTS